MTKQLEKPIKAYLEGMFDLINNDIVDQIKLKPLAKVHMTDAVSNAFFNSDKIHSSIKSTLKHVATGILAHSIITNTSAEILKEGLDGNMHESNLNKTLNAFSAMSSYSQKQNQFNSSLTKVLDKVTNNGRDKSVIEKVSELEDTSKSATLLDYHVTNGSTNGIADKLKNKLHDLQNRVSYGKESYIARSQDPKKMQKFINDNIHNVDESDLYDINKCLSA